MLSSRPMFSICIPAYNRAKFLEPLLVSIFEQNFHDYEIVICEDNSPERLLIRAEVERLQANSAKRIRYFENEDNLGYDANIRNLILKSSGKYCFFMGNDDIMAQGAMLEVGRILQKHTGVGFVLKSYAWFDEVPEIINQEVRYFNDEQYFCPSITSSALCFRRSGVISGFIIDRDRANNHSVEVFDGTLYYQMHIAMHAVYEAGACFTPKVLVLCRNSEAPDFGSSKKEKGVYTPGRYTVSARLSMLGGISKILNVGEEKGLVGIKNLVQQDYANYFYPYVKDQLSARLKDYCHLYLGYCRLGYWRFPMFHFYFLFCRLLGEKGFDRLASAIKRRIGRTIQIGKVFGLAERGSKS